MLTYQELAARLAALAAEGKLAQLEGESRQALAQHRHYLWHMYLIVALLRMGQRDEAGRELEDLMTYKFNLAERAFPEIVAAFPGKFDQHFILDTMKPGMAIEVADAVRRTWTVPYPMADQAAFAQALDHLIAEAVPALPLLPPAAAIATFGSCFAANLARMLKDKGVDATNLLIEESINSPLANRAFLDGLVRSESSPHFARMREAFGEEFLGRARDQLARAQAIVMTLGVAPAFFHAGSDRLAFLEDYRTLLKQDAAYMRTPPAEETKRVIHDLVELLRSLNPTARLYFSVSPVPLMGTAELPNAVLADCVSKSTLRTTLHEVLQSGRWPELHYWPSYEAVRWLGGHSTLAAFGADDSVSRHVSNWLVELIVDRFAKHLFGTASPAKVVHTVAQQTPTSRWSGR